VKEDPTTERDEEDQVDAREAARPIAWWRSARAAARDTATSIPAQQLTTRSAKVERFSSERGGR